MSSSSSETALSPDAPAPRLCCVRKRSDYSGFGFNLHADKEKNGHFIGKVEEGSPAESAGLRNGDRIVEVNGVNVGNENHAQVVERVRSNDRETTFLVLDEEAEVYYRQRDIVVTNTLPNVLRLETPAEDNGQSAKVDHPHKVRLCHLKTWSTFEGYGFNLHVNKGSGSHFIGKIDESSPAACTGLKEDDILIEVNCKNVQDLSHADVVKTIKEEADKVTLLVADEAAHTYFKEKNIEITHLSEFVEETFCPDVSPFVQEVGAVVTEIVATEAVVTEAVATEVVATGTVAIIVESAQEQNLTVSSDAEPTHEHQLRLCQIKSWNDGKGFGFNMQSEKNKPGQYIVKVDDGSPAHLAGLQEEDLIVEVNGTSVVDMTHKQVVDLIKTNLRETKLLVADPKAKEYFTGKGLIMSSSSLQDCIKTISSPDQNPSELPQQVSINSKEAGAAAHDSKENIHVNNVMESQPKKELILDVKDIQNSALYTTQTSNSSNPQSPTIVIGGIEFAATVEEAKRRMAKKKQANQALTMQAKYDIFQKM